MNTLFYSRRGGQGKTTNAVSFARHTNAHFVTFDYDNGTRDLYEDMLPDNHFHEISPTGDLVAYEGESHVFDFGGYLDERIIKTARICDQCVVPIAFQSPAEIKPFIDTVSELAKHNDNIVLLINNTEREYLEDLKASIRKNFDYPIFIIPKSKFVSKLSVYKATPIELFEGNLLALEQELQKLSILFGSQLINIEDAEQLVINQAKFNPFQLIDALLLGQLDKCIAILGQLQQEGTPVAQLIWFFYKEMSQLFDMLEQKAQGVNVNEIFKKYRIWDKRKPLYQHALNQITLANLKQSMSRLAQVDLLSKSSSEFNHYLLLSDICLSLYHGETMVNYPLDYEYN